MPTAAYARAVRLVRHPDAAGHCWIAVAAVALTALGLWTTSGTVSGSIQAAQVPWAPPLEVVRVAWVALNGASTVAACLLWRERSDSRAARGALLLVAMAAVLHLAWLGAFAVVAPSPGPNLWLVLVLLLALDLVTAALACTAWNASRLAGALMFVVLAGLVAGTALALGDTAIASTVFSRGSVPAR